MASLLASGAGPIQHAPVHEALEELLRRPVVGGVRSHRFEEALALGRALIRAGIPALEVATTVPDWPHVLEGWSVVQAPAPHPPPVLGVGSLYDGNQLNQARAAGARFAVSPHIDPQLVRAVHEAGLLAIPGAMTPTEVVTALRAGAQVVKLFPVRSAGGPDFVRALKGPLPHARFWVSGDVSLPEIPAYLAAGAQLIGLTSALTRGPDPVQAAAERVARALSAVGRPDEGPSLTLAAARQATVNRATLRRLPGPDHCSLESLMPGRSGHGVRMRRLLESVGFDPQRPVAIRSTDGFSREVPGQALFDAGVLQFARDGAPLGPEDGGPFRVYLVDGSDRCANVKGVIEIRQL